MSKASTAVNLNLNLKIFSFYKKNIKIKNEQNTKM